VQEQGNKEYSQETLTQGTYGAPNPSLSHLGGYKNGSGVTYLPFPSEFRLPFPAASFPGGFFSRRLLFPAAVLQINSRTQYQDFKKKT